MFGLMSGVAGGIVQGVYALRTVAWLVEARAAKMVSLVPALRARRDWWRHFRRTIVLRAIVATVLVIVLTWALKPFGQTVFDSLVDAGRPSTCLVACSAYPLISR